MNNQNPSYPPLMDLVEAYISAKQNGQRIDIPYFHDSLERLGYSEAKIHELMLEMDDDADKELLAGMGLKKAKQLFVGGLIGAFLGAVLTIALTFTRFSGISVSILPYGLIGAAFITVGKAYAEIGLAKKRRKRRAFKYENWI